MLTCTFYYYYYYYYYDNRPVSVQTLDMKHDVGLQEVILTTLHYTVSQKTVPS